MTDPTTPTHLHDFPAWSDTDAAEPAFARRAANYLGGQGLGPHAIAVALEAELGLCRSEAIALSGTRPTPYPQLISH